ncbi:YqaA family protein [Rhizobium sp. YIM 134829]|uniref:YqaA family protein n=1 Tax=Rhizobium sp. YIM 134829 TaxID=3390453 RepID=UPI00397C1822
MTDLSLFVGIFAAAFLSATLLFGLSEAAIVAALQNPDLSRFAVVAVATGGNVLGALVNYVLGLWFLRFEGKRWFPVSPAARLRAERIFQRFGQPVLLLSWLPVVGDPLTLVAGLLRMPILPFLLFVTLGKAARYGALVALFG